MKKILNLKKYLTLPDAARYLSLAFGEDVSEADLLFFAISRDLTMSIDFVNAAVGRPCQIVTGEGENSLPKIGTKNYIGLQENRGAIVKEEIHYLHGVYDLTLLGGLDYIYLLERYQRLVKGPQVDLVSMAGAFVKRDDDLFLLQSAFDTDARRHGSQAWLKKTLEEYSDNPESAPGIEHYEEDRKRNLEHALEGYAIAWDMPEDSTLVIRTDELRRFVQSLNGDDVDHSEGKPLTTNERNTLLVLIAALCKKAGIDPAARTSAGELTQLARADGINVEIDRDTVRDKLKQIPDALGARQR